MSELIQEIPLYLNGKTLIHAELHKGFSMSFIECWKNKWAPSLDAYLKSGKQRPEHAHWNWVRKATVAVLNNKDDLFFWIKANGDTQGLMILDESSSCHADDNGEGNIYVQFLEVAPWNYYKDASVGYYQGVGSILFMTAVNYSASCGFDGRIGLESLPQSGPFYRAKGMIQVAKNSSNSPLKYFELTTQAAQEALKRLVK